MSNQQKNNFLENTGNRNNRQLAALIFCEVDIAPSRCLPPGSPHVAAHHAATVPPEAIPLDQDCLTWLDVMDVDAERGVVPDAGWNVCLKLLTDMSSLSASPE